MKKKVIKSGAGVVIVKLLSAFLAFVLSVILARSLADFFDLSYGGEFPSYLYHIYPLFLFRMVLSLTEQTEETTGWKMNFFSKTANYKTDKEIL